MVHELLEMNTVTVVIIWYMAMGNPCNYDQHSNELATVCNMDALGATKSVLIIKV